MAKNTFFLVVLLVAAVQWSGTISTASASEPSDSIMARMRQVSTEAELTLGKVEQFKGTFLESYRIEKPSFDGQSVTGTTVYGSKKVSVLLQQAGQGSDRGWMLAIRISDTTMAELVPALKSSLAGDLVLSNPTIVFSQVNFELGGNELTSTQKQFFGKYLESQDVRLAISDGVNLLTSAKIKRGSGLDQKMKMARIDIPEVVIQGVVLKNFDADELKAARQDGTLVKNLAQNAELYASIPGFEVKTLPGNCASGKASLVITGKPSVGIQFDMSMDSNGNRRDFDCQLSFTRSDTGAGKLVIQASAKGDELWENAMGIKGLTLQSAQLQVSIDSQQKAGFETRAKMKLGSRYLDVLGGAEFHALTGAPIRSYFKGKLDRLTSSDLAALANAASGKAGLGQVKADDLPDFELRNLEFIFAPLGGSDDLGIEAGYKMKGDLYVEGSRFASCDVLIDQSKDNRIVSIKARVGTLELGELEVRGTKVDVRMAEKDSHYRLNGTVKLFDNEQSVDIEMTATRMSLKLDGKLAGSCDTTFVYRSEMSSQPVWYVSASVEGNLGAKLGGKLSADLARWADEKNRELKRLESQLAVLQDKVGKLDSEIDRARQEIESDRRSRRQAVDQAQQKVTAAKRKIESLRNQIQSERRAKLSSLKSRMDSANAKTRPLKTKKDKAYSKYKNAKRAYEKARKPFDKAKKKAKMLKAKAAYEVAKGTYNAARLGFDKAKSAYDRAAQTVNRIPVDADPRIVAAKSGLGVAETGLAGARRGLSEIDRVPVDATPKVRLLIETRRGLLKQLGRIKQGMSKFADLSQDLSTIATWKSDRGPLVSIKRIAFETKLGGLKRGGQVSLEIEAMIAGNRKTVSVDVDSSMLNRDQLSEQLISELRKKIF